MKIKEIKCAGLRGATPEGGWSNELQPDDCVHTLIAVHTDEGLIGLGSVFTNDSLVRGALQLLEPLYRGENALEPERVSEKLHQHTFWQGRGGSITHTISGIDIALWDLLGQATGQPVGRLLGGRYRERVRPYASLLMEEPAALRDILRAIKAQGFRAFKIGWGPFGRRSSAVDEAIVQGRARGGRDETTADGGRRRQRRLLAARLQMGAAHRRDARRLRRLTGSRNRCPRTRWTTTSSCAAARRCRSPAAKC